MAGDVSFETHPAGEGGLRESAVHNLVESLRRSARLPMHVVSSSRNMLELVKGLALHRLQRMLAGVLLVLRPFGRRVAVIGAAAAGH